MANLLYYEGKWFSSEDELHTYLEKRFEKKMEEGEDYDYDWINER
jgi:hypothetical protein